MQFDSPFVTSKLPYLNIEIQLQPNFQKRLKSLEKIRCIVKFLFNNQRHV